MSTSAGTSGTLYAGVCVGTGVDVAVGSGLGVGGTKVAEGRAPGAGSVGGGEGCVAAVGCTWPQPAKSARMVSANRPATMLESLAGDTGPGPSTPFGPPPLRLR